MSTKTGASPSTTSGPIAAIDYFVSFREFMPADSANWGIGEATAVYQQGNAFGLWNYSGLHQGLLRGSRCGAGRRGQERAPAHARRPARRRSTPGSAPGPSASRATRARTEAAWTFIQWITSQGNPGTCHRVRCRPDAPFDVQVGDSGPAPAVVGGRLRLHAEHHQPGRAHPRSGMGRDFGHHGRRRQPRLDRRDRLRHGRRKTCSGGWTA
jgi:hypothetical protein